MARVKPDPPAEDVPASLAAVIERRRLWPTSIEVFAAIADAVGNHGKTVTWAAAQLGLRRTQVYRDYWTPFHARYRALVAEGATPNAAIQQMTAEQEAQEE